MPRSKPSRADEALIRQAADAGYRVSATQLERWRRSGLLPAPSRVFLGRYGSRTVYPQGAVELVCALARYTRPGRSSEDVALLAFFDGTAVPEAAVKTALAVVYFSSRFRHEGQVGAVMGSVPDGWSEELGSDYEQAEAGARIDLAEGGRAIRQMRINLRRLPELAEAGAKEVDDRLLGVLVGLNRLRLPQQDMDFMSDLSAALALDTFQEGDDCLAVWEYAAISHASQMAVVEETSIEERLQRLVDASPADLADLRVQVRIAVDQMWERASSGIRKHAPAGKVWLARSMAGMLVEWMSARLVHPPGASLADRYFIESLAHLELCCLLNRRDRPVC